MKIKLTFFIVMLFTISHFFYSCEDIIERDLSKQWVSAIAPADFSVSILVTQTLKWKEIKGAEFYNLQISKTTDSTYSRIEEFVVDTNVRSTQYTCTLTPGFYKWEIVAKNSGSQSGLSRFRFRIDSTSDLSKQKIVLLSPYNNKSTDSLSQVFKWSSISAATAYTFQIYPENSNTALIAVTIPAPTNTYTYPFPATGGVYNWSVFATNKISSTPVSTNKLIIDTSRVPVPNLISPVNDTAVTGNYVPLQWGSVKNATAYSVEVSKNKLQADTAAIIEKPLVTFCNYYHADIHTKYYWRVKAIRGSREGSFSNWVLFKRN